MRPYPLSPGDIINPKNQKSALKERFSVLKAMIGFEPMKDGFADRCLRPLGHIASKRGKLIAQGESFVKKVFDLKRAENHLILILKVFYQHPFFNNGS